MTDQSLAHYSPVSSSYASTGLTRDSCEPSQPLQPVTTPYDTIILRNQGIERHVTIKCGTETWRVKANPLCEVSSTFKERLKDSWKREEEPQLRIDSSHELSVGFFLDWFQHHDTDERLKLVTTRLCFRTLFSAVVFAMDYLIDEFHNDLLDIIAIKMSCGHSLHPHLPMIAKKTPRDGPLMRLLLDHYAFSGNAGLLNPSQGENENLYQQFLVDLNIALYALRFQEELDIPYSPERMGCRYHKHDSAYKRVIGECKELRFDVVSPPAPPQTDEVVSGALLPGSRRASSSETITNDMESAAQQDQQQQAQRFFPTSHILGRLSEIPHEQSERAPTPPATHTASSFTTASAPQQTVTTPRRPRITDLSTMNRALHDSGVADMNTPSRIKQESYQDPATPCPSAPRKRKDRDCEKGCEPGKKRKLFRRPAQFAQADAVVIELDDDDDD